MKKICVPKKKVEAPAEPMKQDDEPECIKIGYVDLFVNKIEGLIIIDNLVSLDINETPVKADASDY